MLENPLTSEINDQTTGQSQQWFERARKVLAGGISSSARITATGNLHHPLYIARGQGAHIWDVDGHEFVDYLLSYGSVILGHADAEMQQVIQEQLEQGTMFGTCNVPEVLLAEQIGCMASGIDLLRYANSGSEAMCGAVRAARGFTGKNKIIKFEGHYHGWVDLLAVSNRPSLSEAGPAHHPTSTAHSKGIPAAVVADVIVCPWNDPSALSQILDEHKGEIAGIVAEPVVANNACIMPQDGYLELLRSQCDHHGLVLIFDEIVTGFRIARGGAQEYFGVRADLSVFSKAIGGGLPISAFGGKRQIMELVAANTVKHGGTYNGNPLCAAGALATLRKISAPGAVAQLASVGEEIIRTINQSASRYGVLCVVQGMGSMFQILFGMDRAARNYRDVLNADMRKYAAFRQALLDQGVHVNSSGMACWFTSLAHTRANVERTCRAIDAAMQQITS